MVSRQIGSGARKPPSDPKKKGGRLRRPGGPAAPRPRLRRWPPGGCGPRAPMEPGRVPAPAPGGLPSRLPRLRRGFFGVLGLGPPPLRLLAAPSGRLAALRVGLAGGPPVGPSPPLAAVAAAGGSPPLRSLWVAPGAAAAYRRAACARRRGPVPPPAGPAAAWPGPAPGGRASPGARPPPRGVWAGGLLSLAAPCRGRCAPAAARPAPLPSSRRVPLPGALPGGPASALGRRASSLRGRLGRLRRPFPRRRPLRGGRSCWCRGGRSLGPGARASPSHPPSRVKTSGASAALDGVCAGWQTVGNAARPGPPDTGH